MGFDAELPTIEEQLEKSPLKKTDIALSDANELNFTIAYIPDPPTVEVKRGHLIEAINKAELASLLIEVDEHTDTFHLFHVTDKDSTAYTASYDEGVRSLVSLVLAEDWFVVEMDANAIPESVAEFLEEMQVMEEEYADEGELFSQTYAGNQLKNRIYDLKQADTNVFLNPEEALEEEAEQ